MELVRTNSAAAQEGQVQVHPIARPLQERLTSALLTAEQARAKEFKRQREESHSVFLRGGNLVGEHLLEENDIRQDLVQK